jgi:hypothetical protein
MVSVGVGNTTCFVVLAMVSVSVRANNAIVTVVRVWS